jgi:hypothetical protein
MEQVVPGGSADRGALSQDGQRAPTERARYFGMKAHVGVDCTTQIIHTEVATAEAV